MEKKHQFAMLASIVHIVNGDWASLVLDLTEMDVIKPGTNIRRFTMVVPIPLIILSFHELSCVFCIADFLCPNEFETEVCLKIFVLVHLTSFLTNPGPERCPGEVGIYQWSARYQV